MTHKIMALLEGKQNSNPLKRSTLRLNSKYSPITLVGSHHKLHIRRHIPLYNSATESPAAVEPIKPSKLTTEKPLLQMLTSRRENGKPIRPKRILMLNLRFKTQPMHCGRNLQKKNDTAEKVGGEIYQKPLIAAKNNESPPFGKVGPPAVVPTRSLTR